MRAAVLGGTFDPPHLAHLTLAAAARRSLGLDRLMVVPAGEPWRKGRNDVTPASTRLSLTATAVKTCIPWAEVSDIEVRRSGPTYAWETMEQLAAEGGSWWFVLGEDALQDLHHWREPGRLCRAARLAVAVRGDDDGLLVTDDLRAAVPGIEEHIDRVAMPALDISSTDLRERIRLGRRTEPILPRAVRELADELGLYRG